MFQAASEYIDIKAASFAIAHYIYIVPSHCTTSGNQSRHSHAKKKRKRIEKFQQVVAC